MSVLQEVPRGEIREGFYIPHGSSVVEVEASFFTEEPRSTISLETRDRLNLKAQIEIQNSVYDFLYDRKGTARRTREEDVDFFAIPDSVLKKPSQGPQLIFPPEGPARA